MSGWNELVERLTDRLGVDPELRLDVAQELRAHLEDSAAEFRRAGEAEAEAADSAARALGDETELAEQLFQANRARMRLRGVIRWAARLTLMPAAVLVIVALLYGLSGGHGYSLDGLLRTTQIAGPSSAVPGSWTRHLSEEQRFVVLGSPTAETPLAAAKSITDRWPDNPIYYGDYVVALMMTEDFYRDGKPNPARLADALAVLDRGERVDPDNAFYNVEKALRLIGAAGTVSEDPTHTYAAKNRRGEVKQEPFYRIDIHDRERFQRGLEEFRRGLPKGEFTGRTVDMMTLRLDLLPKPVRYNDYVRRLGLEISTVLPPLSSCRELAKALCAHAVALAEQGRAAEATALIDSVTMMGAKVGTRARCLVELLVGESIRLLALAHAGRAYDELGRPEQATKARAAFAEGVAFRNEILNRPGLKKQQLAHSGLLGSMVIPSLPGHRVDFEPARTAERFVLSELALLVLLGLLVLAALWSGLLALIGLLARRREDRPVLLFVGWRQVGRICLLAVVLPLAAYALYDYTAQDRVYGWVAAFDKTVLEYTVVIATVHLLLTRLSYSAIRRRAAEVGLEAPAPIRLRDRRWTLGVGALLALVAAVYLAGWWAGLLEPHRRNHVANLGPGLILSCVIGGFLILCKVRGYFGSMSMLRRRYTAFCRTYWRSLVPILAAATILIGISCGWALARAERSAVRRMTGDANIDVTSDIQRSDFRLLRDRLVRQHKGMMAEGK